MSVRGRLSRTPRTRALGTSEAYVDQADRAGGGFLVTTTQELLHVDVHRRVRTVHSGNGLYFGLAQDGRHVFVACRNETHGPEDAEARSRELGSIVQLDAATLHPVAVLRPDFALRDVHGIACFDGALWVTCSFDNMIAIYDLDDETWERWYPASDPSARGSDFHHFNTVATIDADSFAVVAHNHGASLRLAFARGSRELLSVRRLGRLAHDVFEVDGDLATCSSGEGLLRAGRGWTLRTGGFPRGIAMTSDTIVVGISPYAPRPTRHQQTSILRFFDAEWRHDRDISLPGVGMVLAVMSLDVETDSAHFPLRTRIESAQGYAAVDPGNTYDFGDAGTADVHTMEWHSPSDSLRYTAARSGRASIVVNPGERTLRLWLHNGFAGRYSTRVLLEGELLSEIDFATGGDREVTLSVPEAVRGPAELTFAVPHLWGPNVADGPLAPGRFGIGVRRVTLGL